MSGLTDNFSNLSNDKIKVVQQVILPDFELKEMSHSLRTVFDVVQDHAEGCCQL